VVINKKDVVKNVDTATVQGAQAVATAMASFRRKSKAGALFAWVLAATASFASLTPSSAQARPDAGLGADVALSSLSPEARRTDQLIHSGGPFPFPRDGVVFGNYEKRLERRPRGWYHEYTVPTPGARNRGARRIICGGSQPMEPDACFYTEDHYNSFHRIVK
jgi:ribonuclease T1